MSSNEQNPAVRKNKIIDRLKLKKTGLYKKSQMFELKDFYKVGMFLTWIRAYALSSNRLLIYSDNVKDSENTDRWLAGLSSSIVH